jgi:hypothetical protein
MAISEAFSGTASISTTEYSLPNASTTLTPRTEDGIYQLFLDLSALVAGDEYELKLYEKCRSGDTQRVVERWSFTGAQSLPLFASPSLILLHGWDMTLDKIAGTDRTILWSIRQVA